MTRPSGELARRTRGRIRTALALVACLATGFIAVTAGAGGDDGASATSLLTELDRSARKDVAGELVARSRAALARAAKLRASGDEAHARLADGVALRWAEAARDAVRSAEVEKKAATARLEATDAGATADRERALLEEAIAQSGRLRAQIEAAERTGKEQPARTSAAANAKAPTKPASPATKAASPAAKAPRPEGGAAPNSPQAADGGAQ